MHDPIEIISRMLELPGIKLNVQDRWKRTPIHYACMHGATMSAVFLIQKGAKLHDVEDAYGNTPLSTALFYAHWNLALIVL